MEAGALRSALAVLAVDPVSIGGLWLRGRAGPVRQRLTEALSALPLPLPLQKLSPQIGDEALFASLDTAATLRAGRPILRQGLLDRASVLILPMAERCAPGLSARLSQAMDHHRHALIALDETAEEGEGLPPGLADRLGLFLNLDTMRLPERLPLPDVNAVGSARQLLPTVKVSHQAVTDVVRACAELLIISARAPILTLAAARCLAALAGRNVVEQVDLVQAAELTLAHRGLSVEEAAPQPPADQPPEETGGREDGAQSDMPETLPADLMVEAARAALPADVLEELTLARAQRMARGASGSGAERIGNHRGRPMPARKGRPSQKNRLDLIATLRAAAPWQRVRRQASPHRNGQALLVDPGDLHVRRSKTMSDRVLIFAVDTSGSAAFARLAEAKGAVELLLARAYSRRDHVALLTFRGAKAELLLPPTRSLVLTKNRLRGMPGGGATPLAAALKLAFETAQRARSRGMTPTIAVLTDGRGNIALDGSASRDLAEEQTNHLARAIRAAGTAATVIDVGQRPQPRLADLARNMGAHYVALPRVNSGHLATVLEASLDA